MEILDPTLLEAVGGLTVISLLAFFIIFFTWALLKKKVVLGFMYKDKEDEVKKAEAQIARLQDRINTLEAYAWRGTHMAKKGADTAEYYAHQERPPHDPQG